MHGLQPIAKIAPSPNDASQPPPELTTWPPSRSPRPGFAPAAAEGGRAGRRRQRPRRAGIERTPRPLEPRDVEQPGQVEAEHDQDDPADDAQGGQVVGDRAGGERRRDAEQREDGTEPGHVRERVAHRQPARRPRAVGRARDGDRRQLAEVGRHERQHARRQEADDAGREGDEDRQVGPGHRLGQASRTSVRRRRSFAALVTSSRRWSPSSTTGIEAK